MMSGKRIYKIGLWLTIIVIMGSYFPLAWAATHHLEAELADGVVLRVHLDEGQGEEGYTYACEVLQEAQAAYEEVVFKRQFNRPDYTFSQSNKFFAFDSDKTIEIYIADVEAPFALMTPISDSEYKAEILIPADYQGYRQRYHITQPQLELKASLTHELFHIITYSYNRNMESLNQGKTSLTSQRWDWYNEGLARYFETMVGYHEEFLSSGFRQECGERTMVYKGGVNYFLNYPDKPLEERKYDFALFWQYLSRHYGMDKIEEISAKFREIDPKLCTNQQVMEIVAQTLGVPLKNLWRNFSLYVYKISSLPGKREDGLRPVRISKLSSPKSEAFSLYSFGCDFYEIDLKQNLKNIQIKTLSSGKDLNCVIGIYAPFNFSSLPLDCDNSGKINLPTQGLPQNAKIILMLSNSTNEMLVYQIALN